MEKYHDMIVILNGLAQNQIYVSTSFDKFKEELTNVLNKIISDHNIIKQELFILRQTKKDTAKEDIAPASEDSKKATTKDDITPPPDASAAHQQRSSTKSKTSPPPQRAIPTPPSEQARELPTKKENMKQNSSQFKQSSPKPGPPSSCPKILWIGDSISSNVDMNALSIATQATFVTAKAYSSAHNTVSNVVKQAPRFPASNFTDVVPAELQKDCFDTSRFCRYD